MGQAIEYCDGCGVRIERADIDDGIAIVTERGAVCGSCALALKPEDRLRITPPGGSPTVNPPKPVSPPKQDLKKRTSKRNRKITHPDNARIQGSKTGVIVIAAGASFVAVVLILLAAGSKPSRNTQPAKTGGPKIASRSNTGTGDLGWGLQKDNGEDRPAVGQPMRRGGLSALKPPTGTEDPGPFRTTSERQKPPVIPEPPVVGPVADPVAEPVVQPVVQPTDPKREPRAEEPAGAEPQIALPTIDDSTASEFLDLTLERRYMKASMAAKRQVEDSTGGRQSAAKQLRAVAETLKARKAAMRAKLEALSRTGEEVSLETTTGLKKGKVTKVGIDRVRLSYKTSLGRGKPTVEGSHAIKWDEFTDAEVSRLAGDWKPEEGPAGSMAQAIVALSLKDEEAVAAHLGRATEHVLHEHVALRLKALSNKAMEGAAQASWKRVLAAARKSPDKDTVLPLIDDFKKKYDGTVYATSIVEEIRALKIKIGMAAVDFGLVAHWKLDETGGTKAADSTGNGYDGVLKGGASWGAGRIGGAVQLNGRNGKVKILRRLVPPRAGSVAFWIKPSHLKKQMRVIGMDDAFETYLYKGGKLTNQFYGADNDFLTTKTKVAANDWTHICHVFNRKTTSMAIYVNGQLDVSSPTLADDDLLASDALYFGFRERASHGGKEHLEGLLDDVRIYGRVLTPDEIAELARMR